MENQFLKRIENFISDYSLITAGDKIVLGVSGGADSVALLEVLNELKAKLDLRLFVVHINHGLREEALAEEKYVESLCKERDIPFYLFKEDVKELSKKMMIGIEEAGRFLRYESFEKVLKEVNADKIAVAHNSNDLSETMLFNLFRGTGVKGLASISPKRGNIIRPLLCVQRNEIEEFLKERKVSFCIDKSNLSNEYSRNRIRNNILPVVSDEICKEAVSHMNETAAQLRELNEFTSIYIEEAFKRIASAEGKAVSFNKELFLKESVYIRKMLIKRAIDELVPHNKDITHLHIEAVMNISSKSGSKKVNLPYEIEVTASYNDIFFKRGGETKEKPKEIEVSLSDGTYRYGEYKVDVRVLKKDLNYAYSQKTYTKCFDCDKIQGSLMMRARSTGDEIVVTQTGSRKRLKDYMIDEKIPVDKRDFIPILAVGNAVLWVVGFRISEAFKISKDTKRVIEISVSREEEC